MEGGTDHDLRILDLPSEEEEEREKLASASGGAEPPKREDVKAGDGDRKPSVEKDKNEKVCLFPVSVLRAGQIYWSCADDGEMFIRRRATPPAQSELLQPKARMSKRRQRKKLPKKKCLNPRR